MFTIPKSWDWSKPETRSAFRHAISAITLLGEHNPLTELPPGACLNCADGRWNPTDWSRLETVAECQCPLGRMWAEATSRPPWGRSSMAMVAVRTNAAGVLLEDDDQLSLAEAYDRMHGRGARARDLSSAIAQHPELLCRQAWRWQ